MKTKILFLLIRGSLVRAQEEEQKQQGFREIHTLEPFLFARNLHAD